jgi:integrase
MPTKKLTDLAAERIKPPAVGRIEYFDAAFPGLALRVTARGHKSWSLFYRTGGRLRRFTLGALPAFKPAAARREAARILEKVASGEDPAAEKKAQRCVRPAEQDTFGSVVHDYLEHAKKRQRPGTYKETKRVFESDDLEKWQRRPLASISRRDVNEVIDAITVRAEIQANRTLAKLRTFFSWAVKRERIKVSPVEGMEPPNAEEERDRVLSDDEIRWFWTACDASGWPFGPVAKLLLLTAQRRDEVASMEWVELDFKESLWLIPAEKAKNKNGHLVPLSDAALEILQTLPRNGGGLIFTTTGKTPVSGFSRAKRRLDKEMTKASRALLRLPEQNDEHRRITGIPGNKPLPVEIPPWILHDLRRTATTGMARLKVVPHVCDKVLNHLTGKIRGIASVYNKFEYLDERRAALQAWGNYLRSLLHSTEPNVVPFGREGSNDY